MEVWSRHSTLSEALFGPGRNLEQSSSYENFTNQGLQPAAFFELLVALEISTDTNRGNVSWMADLERQLHELSSHVHRHSSAVEVLLDICAELSMDSLYEKLSMHSSTEVAMEDRRRVMLQSSGVSTQCRMVVTCQEVYWARGHSPENGDMQKALQVLPSLKGMKQDCDRQLLNGTIHVLQLLYLHKWCFHRVFGYMDKDAPDSLIKSFEFDQVLRICQTADSLGESKLLRLDAQRLVTENVLEVLEHTASQCAVSLH